MFELVFLRNINFSFKGKDYISSMFVDLKNYKILFGTNLTNADSLVKGKLYNCDVSVSYDTSKNDYKFKVISVK